MNKGSFLFLLILVMLAAVGAYQALFPVPTSMAFDEFFGLSGFLLICISLMIGPLATIWPKSFALLIEPRRAVGLAAFVFALVHIAIAFGIILGGRIGMLFSTLSLELGVLAGILLFILAVSSSDYAIKLLGPGPWKNVQRFNYLIFILVLAHFLLRSAIVSTTSSGQTFVNLVDVFALLMAAAAIILQVAGFFTRRRMMAQNQKRAETPQPPA